MSRISIKTKNDLPAALAPLWDKMTTYGAFENQAGVMAHRPPIFKHVWSLLVDLADEAVVSKRHLELALVTVSLLNKCTYCVSHHAPKLAIQGVSEQGAERPARLQGSSGARCRRQARRRICHSRHQQLEQDPRRDLCAPEGTLLRSPDRRTDVAHRAVRGVQSFQRHPAIRYRAGRSGARGRRIGRSRKITRR